MIIKFKSLLDLLVYFPTEQDCINYLEKYRWNSNVISPYDPASKVYRCKNNRYKCKNTGKYFNAKTGTIFENSNISLQKWFWVLFDFSSKKKGNSSHQLARELDITQKSAWFMLHRVRYTFDQPSFVKDMLKNFVEIDEAFLGGSNYNRHWNKKVPKCQGRNWKDKIPVLGILERNGNLITRVISDTKQRTIEPIIEANIKKGSNVYTDEWYRHSNFLHQNFNHWIVNHSAKQYVNGAIHTNSIEGFWSHLKRGIDGIYHQISRKHAQKYADEFTFRYNTRKYEEKERFDLVLLSAVGKRLTYQQLVN